MEASEFLETVQTMHADGRRRGLFFQTIEDEVVRGRHLRLNGEHVLTWASCSYLGLELHPSLRAGAHEAIDRYGTQFSSSRGYLSTPQYRELESLLGKLFGGHVVVTPTTTLGHQAALGSLVTERDALVFDHQVHASVQVAASLARAQGATVQTVRHGDRTRMLEAVAHQAKRASTVWVLADGVYSMYGDLVSVDLLDELLAIAPNVRVYIDDAHGMSWAGKHGRGSFLSRMPLSSRVTVATSFAKGFGAGGAAVVFADAHEADRMRMCGGPMLFSGPLQPPVLGALVASAHLHLTDELPRLQARLAANVARANEEIRAAGLPLLVENNSPIFFIPVGVPEVAMDAAERVLADGHLVNVSMYPSVPLKRAGLRVAITSEHSLADVDALVRSLGRHVPEIFDRARLTRDDLEAMFDGATPADGSTRYRALPTSAARPWQRQGLELDPASLRVEHRTTIRQVDRALWDDRLGGTAHCSWDAQDAIEQIFRGQQAREHNWDFHYLIVRDAQDAPLAVTFVSVALHKDDMLMRAEVSAEVERQREVDPYFLSSKIVMLGSGLSEGSHLWLNRQGPWRAALSRVLAEIDTIADAVHAGGVMLRDFSPDDTELNAQLHAQGFVKMNTLPTHDVPIIWTDDAGLIAQSSRRMRKHTLDILARDARFDVQITRGGTPEAAAIDTAPLMRLYRNVAEKKLRLNMFFLPDNLLAGLATSPAWEFAIVRLRTEPGEPVSPPVGMFVAHVHGGHYAPLVVGLDYATVFTEKTYRYLLVLALRRAGQLGMTVCHMGMDAESEKLRIGAVAHPTAAWVQARDHYNAAVLHEIVAHVGLSSHPSSGG